MASECSDHGPYSKQPLAYGVRVTTIDKIRHKNVGDWTYEDFKILALTADTGNDDSNLLILFHELLEARLCQKHGITNEVVDAFDKHNQGEDEPGDLPGCPYRPHHQAAMKLEELAALLLGVDWKAHEKRIAKLAG